MKKGVIYHFTDGSTKRPIVYQKQLKELEAFAESQGIEVVKTFVDFSLKKCEAPQLKAMMEEIEQYDVLILKDFYHLNKRTITCFRDLLELHKKGIEVVTMENGSFVFSEVPLKEELRVATYYSANKGNRGVEEAVKLEQDIFELFMKKETNWSLTSHYADICNPHSDTEQVKLMELVEDKDEFDLVLTVSFTDVNGRTARFCTVREMMKKPIYSLKEGYLMYVKEN